MPELAVVPPLPSLASNQSVVDYFLSQESGGTARTYGSAIRAFFAWCNVDYKAITPFNALDYDAYLKATVAPSTVQRHISTLTRFFAFAMKCGLVQTNPFAAVKQHKSPNKANEKFLTVEELDKLLTTLAETRQKDYILGLLLASLGLRISEAMNLSHCDFIEAPSGDIEVNLLRKGNKRQLVPLRQDVWQVVKDFMGHGPDTFDKRPLFTNPSGGRASDVSLRTWVERAAKKAGIKKPITPHWIRHSTATLLLDRGQSLENVRWLLNHSSIKTTAIYLHCTDEKISESMPINVRR